MQMQVVNLRANASRLPRPVARMVNAAVDDFEGDAASNSLAQLNQMLNSTVTQQCESVIANRYPFAKDSERDVPMQDFARIFAPNGVIDRFFAQNLAPMADMSGKDWVWKEDTRAWARTVEDCAEGVPARRRNPGRLLPAGRRDAGRQPDRYALFAEWRGGHGADEHQRPDRPEHAGRRLAGHHAMAGQHVRRHGEHHADAGDSRPCLGCR